MPDYTSYAHSEERRAERGKDRLFLRPPAPTAAKLDAIAAKLNTSRSIAAAYVIDQMLCGLKSASKADLAEARACVQALEEGAR